MGTCLWSDQQQREDTEETTNLLKPDDQQGALGLEPAGQKVVWIVDWNLSFDCCSSPDRTAGHCFVLLWGGWEEKKSIQKGSILQPHQTRSPLSSEPCSCQAIVLFMLHHLFMLLFSCTLLTLALLLHFTITTQLWKTSWKAIPVLFQNIAASKSPTMAVNVYLKFVYLWILQAAWRDAKPFMVAWLVVSIVSGTAYAGGFTAAIALSYVFKKFSCLLFFPGLVAALIGVTCFFCHLCNTGSQQPR